VADDKSEILQGTIRSPSRRSRWCWPPSRWPRVCCRREKLAQVDPLTALRAE